MVLHPEKLPSALWAISQNQEQKWKGKPSRQKIQHKCVLSASKYILPSWKVNPRKMHPFPEAPGRAVSYSHAPGVLLNYSLMGLPHTSLGSKGTYPACCSRAEQLSTAAGPGRCTQGYKKKYKVISYKEEMPYPCWIAIVGFTPFGYWLLAGKTQS